MRHLRWLLPLVFLAPGGAWLKDHPEVIESAVETGGTIFGSITGLQPVIFETIVGTILTALGVKKVKAIADARAERKNGGTLPPGVNP